jgi:hypothetical protein
MINISNSPSTEPKQCDERLPTDDENDTNRMLEAMHVDGFVLIPRRVAPSEVQIARDKIDGLTPIGWDFTGITDHYKNVFNRDPFWLSFLDRNGVIDLAEGALGSDCHIIGETAWRSHPGHRGIDLHLDYLPMKWPAPGVPAEVRVPMFLCTAHFYFSPQTEELCPTRVIPGSHKAGREPEQFEEQWNDRSLQPVLCQAGDVLFFRSDLWHSGSDNRTPDQIRYLLQVHYGRREMAQHFSPFMEWQFNPDVLAACNERQRRLLGDHPPGPYD